MKTMFLPGYYLNGFVASHVLGQMHKLLKSHCGDVYIYIYIYIYIYMYYIYYIHGYIYIYICIYSAYVYVYSWFESGC